ncbi:nucleotidyltransferase family protein [Leadbetterella byssophila]|uniref:nucleotidyltransferase family protein n=1 Tax=Leadbetterella byssophila TaxID=316068 RepID=UPI0039A09641
MSNELQVLIFSYKHLFQELSKEDFLRLISKVNLERVHKIASANAVRLILYSALKSIDHPTSEQLQQFASVQAIKDALLGAEIRRLYSELISKNIECIPYKGILFTEKLYQGKHFRECSDMDLVIRKNTAVNAAIEVLNQNGYKLEDYGAKVDLLELAPVHEVSLYKKGAIIFPIDLHWGIKEDFHVYNLEITDLFSNTAESDAFDPKPEILFKMILNHHGARGCWLRLKEVFDFVRFVQLYPEQSSNMEVLAKKLGMNKVLEVGLELSNFILKGGEGKLSPLARRIVAFWELEESYDANFKWKMKKWFIYLSLQDPQHSKLKLIYRYIIYHGKDTPFYEQYPKPFGGKFPLLNSLVKFIVIGLRSLKGKYK